MDRRPPSPAARATVFAGLLHTARRRAGLTQQALAAATGLPRSLISELEHARSPVRLAHAQALAARLAADDAERERWLAGVHPAAGTRRWGPLTGISAEREQAILDRLRAGLSDRETAAAVGLSAAQVTAVREHHRQAALPAAERLARRFADLDRQIIADYRAGLPYAEIVRRHDVPRSTLYQLLEQYHVPRRRRTGGRRKAIPPSDGTELPGR